MSKQSDLVSVSQGASGDPLFIDTANNRVGIGTSSPEGNLHVLHSSAGTVTAPANFPLVLEGNIIAGMSLLTSNTGEGRIWFGDPDDNDVGRIEYAHSTNAMTFRTNASDRMVIDTSGNLLVGQSSANFAAEGVVIYGPNDAFGSRVNSTSDDTAGLNLNRLTTDGAVAQFFRAGAQVGSISVTASSTSYNTSSDYRLKENVVPLAGAADRLAQIPVCRFNFIADPDTIVDGFLAHEVQDVVPECVTGEKDQVETVDVKDEDGNVIGTEEHPVYQGIDQSKLVPLLTAALQEALQKIDALETRISALETN